MKHNESQNKITILSPETIKNMVYIIRGQKVMLDFELAKLYNYTTSRFNEQVKRNIEKFDETFRFQLTKEELNDLAISQFATSRFWTVGNKGGRTTLPYAFTKQGVYMLMTILKGEVATKQSISLIKMFKEMKDYIVDSNNLLTANEILKLSNQVDSNTRHIEEMEAKLETVMDNFIDPNKYKEFIVKENQRIEADIFFQEIYRTAKKRIIIIDDYISIKTLNNLKVVGLSVEITIASDNGSRIKLSDSEIDDFVRDTGQNICLISSKGLFHDRYLIIDYNTENEIIYDCGASSKDAGNSVSTVKQLEFPNLYHEIIDKLFQ